MFVKGIDFLLFYDFSIRFWKCSDSVFILFFYIIVKCYIERTNSTSCNSKQQQQQQQQSGLMYDL